MKAKLQEVFDSFREFITTHSYQDTPILTGYVDIDPSDPDNQKERPAWLIELKNQAKVLTEALPPEEQKRRANQEKWSRIEETVITHLTDRKPTGKSIVFLSDMEDFLSVDLPVKAPTRLYYGVPQVKHLLFALDEYKKYLVVLFSGAEVRAIEVFLTRSTDELQVETKHDWLRRFGRKSKTLAQERRDAEFERRFAQDVATEINQYFLGDPEFERIVLGGNLKQAHAVKSALHPLVANLVVAVESMDFKLPDTEIAKMVKRIANQYEREHDLLVVNDLLSRYHGNRTAVLELQGVEAALRQGRVKTLVVPYPIDAEKFDPLLVDAIINNAEIEFVLGEGAEKLNEYGGIGASLYYSDS